MSRFPAILLLLACFSAPLRAAPPGSDPEVRGGPRPGGRAGMPDIEAAAPELPGWLRAEDLALPEADMDRLRWLDNFDFARMSANAQGQSMLVLFTTPTCVWCRRLKADVLTDPTLRDRLRRFTLVEINTERHPSLAIRHGVRGVPALLWMDADGRELFRIAGYVNVEDLGVVLDQILTPGAGPETARHAALLKELAEEEPTPERMVRALRVLHGQDPGGRVREALRAIEPVPVKLWIELLGHPRLAIRLGALELLEETAGTARGFDPWAAPGAEKNEAAIAAWENWADDAPDLRPRYSRLTREQFENTLRDLEQGTPERAHRAMRTLELAGPPLRPHIKTLLEDEGLSDTLRERLEELLLTLNVAALGWTDASGIAHRLRRAPLDTRLHLLREIAGKGRPALPVLTAFLDDADILIRENVIESVLKIGDNSVLPQVLERLKQESSIDVAVTAMRNLGNRVTPESTAWLQTQLESDNEERILAALNAIREGGHRSLITPALDLLEDPRWRIRAEVARTIQGTRSRDALPVLMEHANDPDDFARNVILETAMSLAPSVQDRQRMLKTWWEKGETDEMTLLRLACGNRVDVPPEFMSGLAERPKGELLTILGIIDGCQSSRGDVAMRLAEHGDPDVRGGAIRLLARHGLGTGGSERTRMETTLAKAIREGDTPFRMMIIDAIQVPRQNRHSGMGEDPFASMFRHFNPASGTATPEETDAALDDLLSAFTTETPAAQPDPAPAAPGDALEDLFDAFAAPETATEVATTSTDRLTVENVLAEIFESTDDEDLKQVTARVLVEMGKESALPYLLEHAGQMPAEILENILQRPGHDELMIKTARTLLRDPRASVRRVALRQLAARDLAKSFLPLLDKEPDDPESIRISEVDWTHHQLRSAIQSAGIQQTRPFVRKWLQIEDPQNERDFTRLSLAFLMSAQNRDRQNIETLEERATTLVEPRLRAQAWLALAVHHNAFDEAQVEKITGDSAGFVRSLLPFLSMRAEGKSFQWHIHPDMAFSLDNRSVGGRWSHHLPGTLDETLAEMLDDRMPEVRLYAGAALIGHGRALESPEKWIGALSHAADNSQLTHTLWSAIENRLMLLGPEYAPMVDWFEAQALWRVDERAANWRRRHEIRTDPRETEREPGMFEPAEAGDAELIFAESQAEAPPPPDEGLSSETEASSGQKVTLLFFHSHGCEECEWVEAMLQSYQSMYPDLEIREIEIAEPGATDLYYEIFRQYNLPLTQVGLTPMLAGSGDAACGGDVLTYDRIGDLIARSLGEPGDGWIPEIEPLDAPPEIAETDDLPPAERQASPETQAPPPSGEQPEPTDAPRPPATPLQGLLLISLIPLALRLLSGNARLAAFAAAPALLLGALLPLTSDPLPIAVALIALSLVLTGNSLIFRDGKQKKSLSARIQARENHFFPPLILLTAIAALFIGFAAPMPQWMEAIRLAPLWAWGILLLALLLQIPQLRKHTLVPKTLLALLPAATLLGGLLR